MVTEQIVMTEKVVINWHHNLKLSKGFNLCVWMLCLHICLCTTWVPGVCGGQKRTLATMFSTPKQSPARASIHQ